MNSRAAISTQKEALLILTEEAKPLIGVFVFVQFTIQILNFAERVATDVAHTSETAFPQCSSTIVLFTSGGTLL